LAGRFGLDQEEIDMDLSKTPTKLLIGAFLIGLIAGASRFITVAAEIDPPTPRETGCAPGSTDDRCRALASIKEVYDREISPVFGVKCMDCHGTPQQLPLYSKIPGVSGLVYDDIRHAKKDLDMTWGFPFTSKSTIDHDLHEIEEVLEEDEMPPRKYRVMHWSSGLTAEEKKMILEWVEGSRALLAETKGSAD